MQFRFIYLILLLGLISACETEKKKVELPFESKADYEATIIASHQAFLKKEKAKINAYIDSLGLDFDSTGTGLRYWIYEETESDTVKSGDLVVVKYKLKSIEGELLYETNDSLLHEFAIDYDEVESGLHEAIKLMKLGEKGIFILPAHLGHGITGDQAAIPSQTTLVYNLELIGKK